MDLRKIFNINFIQRFYQPSVHSLAGYKNFGRANMKRQLSVVFMGTPEFAVPSLKVLVDHGYRIAGVVSTPDKHGGRGGKKLLESPVKRYALENDLPLLQPPNLKAPEFIEELKALEANLQVVVAFRMLPRIVWEMPRYGTFNLHGSLLPKYRGAAPINWAIINGENQTGVTSFFLQHEIDTGNIIFQETIPILSNDTAGTLHDRMMEVAARVVLKTVQAIEKGDPPVQAQEESKASKAPKIFSEDCRINFDQPIEKVRNFIRGLSPYPTAWTILDGKKLKLFETVAYPGKVDHAPGVLISGDRDKMKIACKDGYLEVLDLQLQGRKRMKTKDFLNGYTINPSA